MLRFHFLVVSSCSSTPLPGCDQPWEQKYPPPLPWSPYSYSIPKLATARKKLGNPSLFPFPTALLLPKVNGIEVWGSLQTHGMFMQTEALAICPKSGQLCHPVPKQVTPWCTLLVQGLLKNSTRASLRSCRGGTAASRLDCNGQPSVQPFQTAPTAIPRGIPHSRDGDNAGLA